MTLKVLPEGRDHPWQSAWDDFDTRILPKLKEHGKEIGERASSPHCASIIKYYTMLHRSFDPMTLTLLEESMKKAGYL